MLKNMIFDMGNVMIKYDPPHFITRQGITNEQDRALLLKEIFHSADWALADAGEIPEAEIEKRACERLPERLRPVVHDLVFHWNDVLEPIPGMADFVRECKQAGMGVYLLSNAGVTQPDYWPKVPGSEYFDGVVVSALERCVKPGREIFERLLSRYGLQADECMFVDDMAVNVEGARKVGLHGFVFDGDIDALRNAVNQLR